MSKTCDCGAKWSHPTDMFLHKRVNCPLKKETFQIQPEEDPFDFKKAEYMLYRLNHYLDYLNVSGNSLVQVGIVTMEDLHDLLRDAVRRLKGE